jgi:hypothetical protein
MLHLLCVFIYTYSCPRFPYRMTFMLFKSNMTGATSGAETAHPSRAHEITHAFLLIFSFLCSVL